MSVLCCGLLDKGLILISESRHVLSKVEANKLYTEFDVFIGDVDSFFLGVLLDSFVAKKGIGYLCCLDDCFFLFGVFIDSKILDFAPEKELSQLFRSKIIEFGLIRRSTLGSPIFRIGLCFCLGCGFLFDGSFRVFDPFYFDLYRFVFGLNDLFTVVDGIENVSVNLLTESAYFEITQKHIEIESVLENLKENGFPSEIYINDFSKKINKAELEKK